MDIEAKDSNQTSQHSNSSTAFLPAATPSQPSQASTIVLTPPNMEVDQVTSSPKQQHYRHPTVNAVPNTKNFIRKRPGWRPAIKIIRPTVPTTTTTTTIPIKRRTRKLSSTSSSSSSSSSQSPSISSLTPTPTEPSSSKPQKPKIKPDAPKTQIKQTAPKPQIKQKAPKTQTKQKGPQAKRKRKRKAALTGRRIIINYKPPIPRGPITSDPILLGSSSEEPASPEISILMTLEPRFPKFGTKQTSLLNFFKKI